MCVGAMDISTHGPQRTSKPMECIERRLYAWNVCMEWSRHSNNTHILELSLSYVVSSWFQSFRKETLFLPSFSFFIFLPPQIQYLDHSKPRTSNLDCLFLFLAISLQCLSQMCEIPWLDLIRQFFWLSNKISLSLPCTSFAAGTGDSLESFLLFSQSSVPQSIGSTNVLRWNSSTFDEAQHWSSCYRGS